MELNAEFLVGIGGILLLGLAADAVGRRTFLPRVTLLLICGVIIGDDALGIIPTTVISSFELIANLALMMIGFLLGGKLSIGSIKKTGRQLLWISASAVLGTMAVVTLALLTIGVPPSVAILLGCIAAATAPAATVDTVLESGTDSRFSRLLLAIVAIDDAWSLILFSVGLAVVSLLNGAQDVFSSSLDVAHDILGAILLGGIIGLPAANLTGRIKPGQPMLTEALGLVLICGGVALWLNVSFLIATMTMGAVIANIAVHHEYPFHEIENIEWPFMVVFFVLAGASLEVSMFAELGLIGAVYLLARAGGKLLGAWFGGRASHAGDDVRRWMGMALLPQAGVAIGMALLAANQFPDYRQIILPIVVASTVFFELIGPIFTRMALRSAKQAPLA
jgi:Kef-type K+ transport system membrane component KefB